MLVVLFFGALSGCSEQAEWKVDGDNSDTSSEETVREIAQLSIPVEIRFNGRKEDLDLMVKCAPETTVLLATLNALEKRDVEFEYRGNGETAFVVSIGGIANENSAGDNWVYRVNDELGNVGSGVAQLKKGDRITWSFGKYELDN